jgi:hypothetical protein
MRVLLDAHPRICCGPELKALPPISGLYKTLTTEMRTELEGYGNSVADIQGFFREFVDNLTGKYRRAAGKPRWAEKSPHNIMCMITLGTIFPDAQFIHVIRDGRDVACSLVTMNWLERPGVKVSYVQNITNAAKYWRAIVLNAQQLATQPILAGRIIEVRYEALIADVEGTMRQVLGFLGEEWDPAILEAHKKDRSHEPQESSTDQVTKPIYNTAMGRWRRDMSPADKIAFKSVAGQLLKELGYAKDDDW